MDSNKMTKVHNAGEYEDGVYMDFSQGVYSGMIFIQFDDDRYFDEGYDINKLDAKNYPLVADFIDHYGIDLSKLPSIEDASAPTQYIYDFMVNRSRFDILLNRFCFYLINNEVDEFLNHVRDYKFPPNKTSRGAKRLDYGLREAIDDLNNDLRSFDLTVGDLEAESFDRISQMGKNSIIIAGYSDLTSKFSTYNIFEIKRAMDELGFKYDEKRSENSSRFYFTGTKGNIVSFGSHKEIVDAINSRLKTEKSKGSTMRENFVR